MSSRGSSRRLGSSPRNWMDPQNGYGYALLVFDSEEEREQRQADGGGLAPTQLRQDEPPAGDGGHREPEARSNEFWGEEAEPLSAMEMDDADRTSPVRRIERVRRATSAAGRATGTRRRA